MKCWQIILAAVFFFPVGGRHLPAQQVAAPAPVVAVPSTAATAPVAVSDQPYVQTTPTMIEPGSRAIPMYPPSSTVVPLPSQTPGSIFGPPVPPTGSAAVPPPTSPVPPSAVVAPGAALPGPPVVGGLANPIVVPVVDDELAWDQIADVVSDYFKIAREQRARRGVEGWMEGRIDTVPQDSATWLEPHRQDSIGTFNRWESTFQSIRRRATVRIIPDAGSYRVEVIVEKEIEDLPRPEKATTGAATLSTNITLPVDRPEDVSRTRRASRWLALGRDPALEQRMLAEIHARLNGIASSRRSLFAR